MGEGRCERDGGGGEVREGGEREDEKLHCRQSLPQHCMNRVVSGTSVLASGLFSFTHPSAVRVNTTLSQVYQLGRNASCCANIDPHLLGNQPKFLDTNPKNHSFEGSNISLLLYSPCTSGNKPWLMGPVSPHI